MEYSMTCYHVASPGDNSNKTSNDEDGIGINGSPPFSSISVTCPSPADEVETRECILKNPHKSMKDFEDTISVLGDVAFASGNRQ